MPNIEIHPVDKMLIEDSLNGDDKKRYDNHHKHISWLRRSEYISSERIRFQPQSANKSESQLKKSLLAETLYMDRKTQIKAIQKTFSDSKSEIQKHYWYNIHI